MLAQGTVQVDVLGIGPVLETPFVSELTQRFETGRYPIRILYSSPTAQTTAFRLEAVLRRDGGEIARVASEPFRLAPGVYTYLGLDGSMEGGPPIIFAQSLASLVDGLPSDDRDAIRQTGALAEGVYTLEVIVRPDDPSSLVVGLGSTVVFQVRLSQPPILFEPVDASDVRTDLPIFTWAPVVAPAGTQIEYDFLLVEVLPGQTPLQAVQSNRAYHEEVVVGTTLLYTPDKLPLEEGNAYAWQVRASDPMELTAFANEGLSEVRTFTFAPYTIFGQVQLPIRLLSPTISSPIVNEVNPFLSWTFETQGADVLFRGGDVRAVFVPTGGPQFAASKPETFTSPVFASPTGPTLSDRIPPTFNKLKAGVDYTWFLTLPDRQISDIGTFKYRPGGIGPILLALMANVTNPRAGETVTFVDPTFVWEIKKQDRSRVNQMDLILEQNGQPIVTRSVRVQPSEDVAIPYVETLSLSELLTLNTDRGRGASVTAAVRLNGDADAPAERRTFTYKPELPLVLTAPQAQSVVAGTRVDLRWQGALSSELVGRSDLRMEAVVLTGASETIRVPIGKTERGVTIDLEALAQQNAAFAPVSGTTYRWRLELTNGSGWTARSPMASFSVAGTQLTLTAPTDQSRPTDPLPTFEWRFDGPVPSGNLELVLSRGGAQAEQRIALAPGQTRYTVTGEQALTLGTNTDGIAWTLHVDGNPAAPSRTFSYAPEVAISVLRPSDGSTVSGGFLDLTWNVDLPPGLAGTPLELVMATTSSDAKSAVVLIDDAQPLGNVDASGGGSGRVALASLGVNPGEPFDGNLWLRARSGSGFTWSTSSILAPMRITATDGGALVSLTSPANRAVNADPLVAFEWTWGSSGLSGEALTLVATPVVDFGRGEVERFDAQRFALQPGQTRYTPTGAEQWLLGAGPNSYVEWHLEFQGQIVSDAFTFRNSPRVDLTVSGLSSGQQVRADAVDLAYTAALPSVLAGAGAQLFANYSGVKANDPSTFDGGNGFSLGKVNQGSGTVRLPIAGSARFSSGFAYGLDFYLAGPHNASVAAGPLRPNWIALPGVAVTGVTFREAQAPTLVAPSGLVESPLFRFEWNAPDRIRANSLSIVVVPVAADGTQQTAQAVRFSVDDTRATTRDLAVVDVFRIGTAYQSGSTGNHVWYLEGDGVALTQPTAFRYEPTFNAPLTNPTDGQVVAGKEFDAQWSIEVPSGMTGTRFDLTLAMRVGERDAGIVSLPLGTVQGSFSGTNTFDVRALPLDSNRDYLLGILVRPAGQPNGWTATSYDPTSGVRFAAADAALATLTGPQGVDITFEPFFQWTFDSSVPDQPLYAVVREPGENGQIVVQSLVTRDANGALPTYHKLSPAESMQLGYGREYEVVMQMGGVDVSNTLPYRYAPQMNTLVETYPTLDTDDMLVVGPETFTWSMSLPDEQVTRFVDAGARYALLLRQGELSYTLEVGDEGEAVVDLRTLRNQGFDLSFTGSIRWNVTLYGPGGVDAPWGAISNGAVFSPGREAITVTSPAGFDTMVDDLLPTITWTANRPLTDDHALALQLTPRDDSDPNQPLMREQAIRIPLPLGATSYTLTPSDVFGISIPDISGRTLVADILVNQTEATSGAQFVYVPLFQTTLDLPDPSGARTFGDVPTRFEWTTDVDEALFDAGASTVLGFRDLVSGERRSLPFVSRGGVTLPPSALADLETDGFAFTEGEFYEWFVGLTSPDGRWRAYGVQVVPLTYQETTPEPAGPAPFIVLTAPDDSTVVPDERPTFTWRYQDLPAGVDASTLVASVVFTRITDPVDNVPAQAYFFVDAAPGATSYRLDRELTALDPGVEYTWTVGLTPDAASPLSAFPDRLESDARVFAYRSAPPEPVDEAGGWNGFLTYFAELVGIGELTDADGDGDLDGQAAIRFDTDPVTDRTCSPPSPSACNLRQIRRERRSYGAKRRSRSVPSIQSIRPTIPTATARLRLRQRRRCPSP